VLFRAHVLKTPMYIGVDFGGDSEYASPPDFVISNFVPTTFGNIDEWMYLIQIKHLQLTKALI